MIYQHKYFTLNEKTGEVLNRYGEDIDLTGYPFQLLLCLCKRAGDKVLTDEIEIFLDMAGARGFTHDQIRQYRVKIKDKLNTDIINFKNEHYWLEGPVKILDKMPEEEKPEEPVILEEKELSPTPQTELIPERTTGLLRSFLYNRNMKIIISIFILAILIVFGLVLFTKPQNNVEKPTDDMVLIPAGEFIFGSTEEQIQTAFQLCQKEEGGYCLVEDYLAEYPQTKIFLPDFYIDRKEVSNVEYEKFIQATNREVPLYWDDKDYNQDNQPVVGVIWQDAQAYCQWLNKRLPTEQEWEKATRGVDGRIWSWGNEWDGSKINHGRGGLPGTDDSDGYLESASVGAELGVSPYGLLNTVGNVAEWVDADFKPYKGNDKSLNEDFGELYKVMRGGSYINASADLRAAARTYEQKEYKDTDVGFRCVRDK